MSKNIMGETKGQKDASRQHRHREDRLVGRAWGVLALGGVKASERGAEAVTARRGMLGRDCTCSEYWDLKDVFGFGGRERLLAQKWPRGGTDGWVKKRGWSQCLSRNVVWLGAVAHACNPSTLGG